MRLFATLLIAVAAPAWAASASANVAPCDLAVQGTGPAGWKQRSLRAGPVGVFKRPLAQMQRTRAGLVAKMPLLVEGQEPVILKVPAALRGRVFLYYGELLDRDGQPSTSFVNTVGTGETRFEPCRGRPRTPWPGGIRVRGTDPVRLLVSTEERAFTLRLGRPRVFSPTLNAG